jgi:hypothetical protein
MLKPPYTYTFRIDGDTFTLTEYQTRGSEARIQLLYAQALNPAPLPLSMHDGGNLWVEAVAKECLSQAPAWCWRDRFPDEAGSRFDPNRVVTLEEFPRLSWPIFRKEVNAFLADLPQVIQPDHTPTPRSVSRDADPLDAFETVPALLRGRAE